MALRILVLIGLSLLACAWSQPRAYVLRSGDSAADTAVASVLRDRGFAVSLGVAADQLAFASVRLSDFALVVATDSGEEVPTAAMSLLTAYLDNSGALLADGGFLYRARLGPALRMPGTYCGTRRYTNATTTVQLSDPMVDGPSAEGVAASFPMELTTVLSANEACISQANNGRIFASSRGGSETAARPALVGSERGPGSRIAVFAASFRSRELQNADFRQLFGNAAVWAASVTNPTEPEVTTRNTTPRRVYILRSADAESDAAIVQAVAERGHTPHLGVRASDLEFAAVRLEEYHAVVALGVASEELPSGVLSILQRYLLRSGGLIADGPLMYFLRNNRGQLDAAGTYCGSQRLSANRISLERAEPLNPTIGDGIPSAFSLDLTEVNRAHESCLSPATDGRILFYSRSTFAPNGRPGVIGRDVTPRSRALSLSMPIRARELRNADFRRLFGNLVEWVSDTAQPESPPEPPGLSKSLRVYLTRSGDSSADDTMVALLRERGHQPTLGVRFSQLTSAATLAGFSVLVGTGVNNETPPAIAVSAVATFLQNGGRMVIDGPLANVARSALVDWRAPATSCGLAQTATTNYDRIDPPAVPLHDSLPPSFAIQLSQQQALFANDTCLSAAPGGRIQFYSRWTDTRSPNPAVVTIETPSGGRMITLSAALRSRELQSPDFRRLAGNAIEWAGGQFEPPPPLRVSPNQLSFVYNTSADAPRSQRLLVTPATLTNVPFTVTATAEWIRVGTSNGTTPQEIRIETAPVFLAPGTYTGDVVIQSGGSTVRVPVRTTVNATAPCTYSLSPDAAAFPAAGGTGRIGIATPAGCAWTLAGGVPAWVSITGATSGSGPGTVGYSIQANATASPRTGAVILGGRTFTIQQAGTAVSLRAEPSSLTFQAVEGASTAGESRLVSVVLSSGSAPYTAMATGGAWLRVAPASGTAPASIAVSADPGGLAAGTYRGTIVIRVPSATPPETSLPVTLTVSRGDSLITVDQPSLILPTVVDGEPRVDSIRIGNRGRADVTYRASADASWLRILPDSGLLRAGGAVTLILSANPQGLSAGSYTARLRIAAAGTSEETVVQVVLTVANPGAILLLSQTGLSFTAVQQGGRLPEQTVGVLNTGIGSMDWTATPSTRSGGSWLSVTQGRGTAQAGASTVTQFAVNVDAANLRPGDYYGSVSITAPNAVNAPQSVSVLLRVLPPGSDPGPIIRPTGLIFIGSGRSSQEVTIHNPSAEQRSFNSTRLTLDDKALFTHAPVQAVVSPAAPARVSIEADAAGSTPGVRRGALTLLFNDGAVQHVNILSLVPERASSASSGGARAAASCPSPELTLAHRTLRQGFVATSGEATTIEITAADACGNPLVSGRLGSAVVVATFSNGDPRVNLVHTGNGQWTGTWRPLNAVEGVVVDIAAIDMSAAPRVQAGRISVNGSVAAARRTPIISAGGLTHAASYVAGAPVAPGSLITLYGANLADTPMPAESVPLPRELNGVEVLLGDRPLPLLFVSRNQLNVQVPFALGANTQHTLAVRRGDDVSVAETITVATAVPGIFTRESNGKGQGLIFNGATGTLADAANPVRPGDTVVIYCTGLGAVTPQVEPGDPSSGSRVITDPELRIGGEPADIVYAGLTPNAVGLYQINAIVPGGIAAGDGVEVTIAAAGQISPPVTMSVRR